MKRRHRRWQRETTFQGLRAVRTPSGDELERWARLAEATGNVAVGGSKIRFGGTDLIAYPDGLYLRLTTPLPVLMCGAADRFRRSSDGAIVLPLSGYEELFDQLHDDLEVPAAARKAAGLVSGLISMGFYERCLLAADTDLIWVAVSQDDGSVQKCEALPPEFEFCVWEFEEPLSIDSIPCGARRTGLSDATWQTASPGGRPWNARGREKQDDASKARGEESRPEAGLEVDAAA